MAINYYRTMDRYLADIDNVDDTAPVIIGDERKGTYSMRIYTSKREYAISYFLGAFGCLVSAACDDMYYSILPEGVTITDTAVNEWSVYMVDRGEWVITVDARVIDPT